MTSPNGSHSAPRPAIHSFEQVYAIALLDLGEESGQIEAVGEEVAQLGQIVASQPDLLRLMSSRSLSAEERAGALERIFRGRVSDLLFRFLLVVNRKGRLEALPGILRAFQRGLEARRGVVEVDAFVADRLSEAQAFEVAARIGALLNRQVVLHQYVDESLIGGLKLRVGDEIIDGSVATQLKLMREQLVEAGRERSRAQGVGPRAQDGTWK